MYAPSRTLPPPLCISPYQSLTKLCNGPQHYERVASAIHARYPDLQLIANCDLGPNTDFLAWEFHSYRDPGSTFKLRKLIEEHQVGTACLLLEEWAASAASRDRGGSSLHNRGASIAWEAALDAIWEAEGGSKLLTATDF